MGEEIEVPVVIIGGGPVGLTVSYILGKNDIENVLLEKNETTSKWPKAILINPRSMELYRRLGLDKALREEAVPGRHYVIIGKSLINGKPAVEIPFTIQLSGKNPQEAEDGTIIYDKRWSTELPMHLPQIDMEPILKREASKHIGTEINFGWKVQSISQTQENVIVEAINDKTGETKIYRARYAVGCDGGKSFVRKSLGLQFNGAFNLSHFNSISFQSPEFKKKLVKEDILGATLMKRNFIAFMFPLNTEGRFVAHIMQQNYSGDKELHTEEIMKTLFDGEDIPYTVDFENEWQGHFATSESLQENRIFLAGDSSHIMIPVGGFGLNTGVLDAFDLSWKMVATIKGWGGERLLASYTEERLPAIRKLVHRVQQIYNGVTTYGRIFVFFLTVRPFGYILRTLVNIDIQTAGFPGLMFGIRLDTSPICVPSAHTVPPEDPSNYTPLAHSGCRAPPFQFHDGTSLYDKLGSAFTLLHLQPSSQNFDPIMAAAAHCGVPLKVVSLNDAKLKDLYGGMDLIIIRPDLYIAWCGCEIPTLLHNEDVNEGARVLMKVITGVEPLPAEWQRKQKNASEVRTAWWIPIALSVIVGVSAVSFTFLRHYKWIE